MVKWKIWLTVEEMPAHTHNYKLFTSSVGTTLHDAQGGKFMAANFSSNMDTGFLCSPGLSNEFHLYSTGGDAAHMNMQPYQTVYIFRRQE